MEKDTSKTWEEVNKYFGNIFSSLFPNTDAKLIPVVENDLKQGL